MRNVITINNLVHSIQESAFNFVDKHLTLSYTLFKFGSAPRK